MIDSLIRTEFYIRKLFMLC